MNNFISTYGLFVAESLTIVAAIMLVFIGVLAITGRNKDKGRGRLQIIKLNTKYDELKELLQREILSKEELSELRKQKKREVKRERVLRKQGKMKSRHKDRGPSDIKEVEMGVGAIAGARSCDLGAEDKRRIFILGFCGDIRASEVENLRREVTAILTVATPKDEVVVKIESAGGVVHGYGLVASQLKRIRDRNIPLTAIVDKIAASGGYMVACVADRILAAPFAIVGSVGVIRQLPNFNRLFKKHHIDFEQITAGEYKRTLSLFGENTNKGRQKLQEEVDETHGLFKTFVAAHRPVVNVEAIATGEYWYGLRARELRLIDDILTSDDYLLQASKKAHLYEINYMVKKSWAEKFGFSVHRALNSLMRSPL